MQEKTKIRPFTEKATYLDSRIILERKGLRLASNLLHDEILVSSNAWESFAHLYPSWARELLVYPEEGGKLRKGKDLLDPSSGWVFPAEYIRRADEAKGVFGHPDAALVVEPGYFEPLRKGRTAVHPRGTAVLHCLPLNGECGIAYEFGIPIKVPAGAIDAFLEDEIRWIRRSCSPSVVPIVRGSLSGYDFGYGNISLPPCPRPSDGANKCVFADYDPSSALGVFAEERETLGTLFDKLNDASSGLPWSRRVSDARAFLENIVPSPLWNSV